MKKNMALALGLFLSGPVFGEVAVPHAPTVSDSAKKEWLALVDQDNYEQLGFDTVPDKVTVGKGIPVALIAGGFYEDSFATKAAKLDTISKFLFPIYVDGAIKSLFVMSKDSADAPFTMESIGQGLLAQRIEQILAASHSFAQDLVLVEDVYTNNTFAINQREDLTATSQVIAFSTASINDAHRVPATMTLSQYRASRMHLKDMNTKIDIAPTSENVLLDSTDLSIQDQDDQKECKTMHHSITRSFKAKKNMKDLTIRDWQEDITRIFSQSWSNWKLAKDSRIACKKNFERGSEHAYVCSARAIPCRHKDSEQSESRQLRIRSYNQEQNYWCWAAVSQSVINYVSSDKIVDQCRVANLGLRRKDCCASPLPRECNKDADMGVLKQTVWKRFGVFGSFSPGAHSYDQIKRNINRNRPAAISWRYRGKSIGHLVFYSGYHDGRTNSIFINDPSRKTGNSWMAYDKVRKTDNRIWNTSLTASRKAL